jgi:DNA-binding Lrp family transcriptional regulator
MKIDVDGAGYDSATEALFGANHSAAIHYNALIGKLGGFGAMAGDDKSSGDFTTKYDAAARGAVGACNDLVDAFATLGILTAASIDNHRKANAGSVYGKPQPVYDGGALPGDGPVDVSEYTPPSALGGDNEDLPDFWNLITDYLEGWTWPGADTGRLRQAATAWRTAATCILGLTSYCIVAVSMFQGQRSPEIPLAIDATNDLKTQVTDLAAELRAIGDACDDYATQVEQTRAAIRGFLTDLAISGRGRAQAGQDPFGPEEVQERPQGPPDRESAQEVRRVGHQHEDLPPAPGAPPQGHARVGQTGQGRLLQLRGGRAEGAEEKRYRSLAIHLRGNNTEPVMRTSSSPLLPLLRSRVQGDLLALVYLNPDEEYSITEVAHRIGASVKAVHQEVTRLVETGLLSDRKLGTSRLVRSVQNSLLTRALTDLLAVTYGPLPVLTRSLAGLEAIEQAFIYGSWAARYNGEPGPVPADVDVLVVGDVDPDDLDERAREAEAVLRREVNIRRLRPATWENEEDPFVATVKTRPLVELHIHTETDTGRGSA